MNKILRYILLVFVICTTGICKIYAQDYLVLNDADPIPVSIIRIDSAKVFFKEFESVDTTQYFITKDKVTALVFTVTSLKNIKDIEFKNDPIFKTKYKDISPDYIYPIEGDMIKSFIESISEEQVQFHLVHSNDTSTYFLKKSEIEKITFKEILINSNKESEMTDMELAAKGRSDAYQYYDGYKPAAIGSFVAGIFGIYLIPAVVPLVLSVNPPMEENLGVMNDKLSQKPAYMNSYTKTAKSIKSNKVWSNFGYGALTSIGLIFGFAILVTSSYH